MMTIFGPAQKRVLPRLSRQSVQFVHQWQPLHDCSLFWCPATYFTNINLFYAKLTFLALRFISNSGHLFIIFRLFLDFTFINIGHIIFLSCWYIAFCHDKYQYCLQNKHCTLKNVPPQNWIRLTLRFALLSILVTEDKKRIAWACGCMVIEELQPYGIHTRHKSKKQRITFTMQTH